MACSFKSSPSEEAIFGVVLKRCDLEKDGREKRK
jgi:hypothetical protein